MVIPPKKGGRKVGRGKGAERRKEENEAGGEKKRRERGRWRERRSGRVVDGAKGEEEEVNKTKRGKEEMGPTTGP